MFDVIFDYTTRMEMTLPANTEVALNEAVINLKPNFRLIGDRTRLVLGENGKLHFTGPGLVRGIDFVLNSINYNESIHVGCHLDLGDPAAKAIYDEALGRFVQARYCSRPEEMFDLSRSLAGTCGVLRPEFPTITFEDCSFVSETPRLEMYDGEIIAVRIGNIYTPGNAVPNRVVFRNCRWKTHQIPVWSGHPMDLASVDVQQDIVFENCVVEVEHRYPRSADPNACVIAANKGSILANRTTFISRMLSSEGHPDYTQCLSVTDYHCYQRAQQAPECNFFVGGYPVNNTVIATDCTFEIAPGHDHGWNAHILAGTCPFLIERGLFIAHGELSSQQVIRQEIPGVEMSEQTEESSPGVMKSSNPLGG